MKDFHKYAKIYRIGHNENKDIFTNPDDRIIIEEKMDGANFRFMITEEGKVIIGSRTQQLTSDEGNDTNLAKDFKRCADYVRKRLKMAGEGTEISCYAGYIFYGEDMHKHTMTYDWDNIPPYLGFDIMKDGKFLGFVEKTTIFGNLFLHTVPLVDAKYARDITQIDDSIVPVTKYPPKAKPDLKAEGVVFKNYNNGIFAKYVRDEFKEANAETFGGNPKYNKDGDNDNADILFKYCTNARIDKNIFKLVDEGHKLEMSMMQHLPKRVYADIIEEEGNEIMYSNWKVDFKELRKKITKRCLAVLGQVITNNSLSS